MAKKHPSREKRHMINPMNIKRVYGILFILIFVLTLGGCGSKEKVNSDTINPAIEESQGSGESTNTDDFDNKDNATDEDIQNKNEDLDASEDKASHVDGEDKSSPEQSQKENKDTTKDTVKSTTKDTNKDTSKDSSKDKSKDTSKDFSTTIKRTGLKVHFVDVGQGDGIVIEADGHYMVIDGGNNEYGTTMVKYLNNLGVKKLDYVIGTHPHADHVGGLDDVINNFEIKKAILSPKLHTSRTYEDVLDALLELNLSVTKPVVGDVYQLGSSEFTIIAPSRDYGDSLNDWSVGIKLVYGENSFILYADGELPAEYDMLDNGIDMKADVFKAAHHGSDTSNSEAMLKAVDPKYIVISVGEGNSYGHPSRSIIDRFVDYGIPYFRTDDQGTIIASSDGSKITWNVKPSISLKSGDGIEPSQSQEKNDNTSKETTAKETNSKVNSDKVDTSTSNDITVFITKTGTKYHRESCSSLSKSSLETTLQDALDQDLEPCSKCNPPS